MAMHRKACAAHIWERLSLRSTLIPQTVHNVQEDGAHGDVILQHVVVEGEEDPLLGLEEGGVEQLG
eukprot:8808412-Alexandrium_andersonii.AAC.1